jgi:hypothetical protein
VSPKFGDVLIRGEVGGGFEIVDAVTRDRLSGHVPSLQQAIVIARLKGGRIWQQAVDARGRALGDPVPLEAV